jgi:hypothetical protein
MPNKYMRNCSISLVIKELQIKTMLRLYVTPVRVAMFKKANTNKYWHGCVRGVGVGEGTYIYL